MKQPLKHPLLGGIHCDTVVLQNKRVSIKPELIHTPPPPWDHFVTPSCVVCCVCTGVCGVKLCSGALLFPLLISGPLSSSHSLPERVCARAQSHKQSDHSPPHNNRVTLIFCLLPSCRASTLFHCRRDAPVGNHTARRVGARLRSYSAIISYCSTISVPGQVP